MRQFKNAMEIFKHLEKSNCRECGEKTCLAFVGAVYQSRKEIRMCPRLDWKIVELYSGVENRLSRAYLALFESI